MEKRERRSASRITDYSVYFTSAINKRKPFKPFVMFKHIHKIPEVDRVFMASGMPNSVQFPVVSASFKTSCGDELTFTPKEMEFTLQYSLSTKGMKSLLLWLKELVKTVHSPPTLDDRELASSMDILLCSGGREGLSKCLALMLEEGDSFLSEEFVYQTMMSSFLPRGIKSIPIQMDAEGMDAGHLNLVLSEWDEGTQGRRPRLLYVVPTCSNPTGRTWSERRKREVYVVARQFDLLIVEDDPYYHLQYKKPFCPSLLSMDEDGRVIRIDSFSKTISPGLRLGSIYGPKAVLDQLVHSIYIDTGGPSHLSQMFVWKVLEQWGIERYRQHEEMLSRFYEAKMETMLKLLDTHLKGLVEWTPPDGGMFVWIKIPGVDNPWQFMEKLMERGVFVMTAEIFSVDYSPKPYFRLSSPSVTDQQMEKGFKVIAELIRELKESKEEHFA